jgi:hypothetical protein
MIQYGIDLSYHSFSVQVNGKWWKVEADSATSVLSLKEWTFVCDGDFRRLKPEEIGRTLNQFGRLTESGKQVEVGEEFAIMVRISEIFGFPIPDPQPALVVGRIGAMGRKQKDEYLPYCLTMNRVKGEAVPTPRRRKRSHWPKGQPKPGTTKEVVTVERSTSRGELVNTQKVQLDALGNSSILISQIMRTLSRAESAACAVARMVERNHGYIQILPDGTARRAS